MRRRRRWLSGRAHRPDGWRLAVLTGRFRPGLWVIGLNRAASIGKGRLGNGPDRSTLTSGRGVSPTHQAGLTSGRGVVTVACTAQVGREPCASRGSGPGFGRSTTEMTAGAAPLSGLPDSLPNLPFSEWGAVLPDPRLVAAIVDRVTYNANILETRTQCYKLATSKTTRPASQRTRSQNS